MPGSSSHDSIPLLLSFPSMDVVGINGFPGKETAKPPVVNPTSTDVTYAPAMDCPLVGHRLNYPVSQ
jgi:hypothetical protein